MDYSVGSLADFISGSNTPNKPKVIVKKSKQKAKKLVSEKQINVKQQSEKSFKEKAKKSNDTEDETNQIVKEKPKKRKSDETLQLDNQDVKKVKKSKKKIKKNKSCEPIGDNNTVINEEKIDEEGNKEKDEKILAITKEHNERTIFVGNLPLNINKNVLKKLFEKFGRVESVRLRSAPIADDRTPKKVAIIKKQFHKDRKSINGYVRFISREDAIKATAFNGNQYKDHHIRVKMCDDTEKPDQNKAIFLGNVSFDAEEEELWKIFESCGEIESVRLVRDRKTDVGKGFGYVNFKSADSVELALQMENVKLKNRELRISACVTKKTKKKLKSEVKKSTNESKPSEAKVKVPKGANDFQGKKIGDKKKKKFNKGNVQKKRLVKKIAPKSIA